MIIESIELQNYRNIEKLKLPLGEKNNILYGDNAQGKTNLLEAIFFGSTGKSFRFCKDKELIHFGAEEAHLKMILKKKGISHRIDIHLKKNKSKNTIAVINLEGEIDTRESRESVINYDNVVEKLEALEDIKNLKGLVLRINSPGGSALESEKIYQKLKI